MSRVVAKLRKDLTPQQLQKVLKNFAVGMHPIGVMEPYGGETAPSSGENSEEGLQERLTKEVCLEIARGGFESTREQIEKMCLDKLKAADREDDADDRERHRRIVEAVVRETECLSATSGEEEKEVKEDISSIQDIKENMATLIDMLQSVKTDNEDKDRQLREMKDKMEALEQVVSDKQKESRKKVKFNQEEEEGEKKFSPRYVRSDDFSKPSPGVVVPPHITDKEARIAWLMENDVAFRRGRLRR